MTTMRFPSLFRRSAPVFDAPLAPEAPFCAIGDIHGRRDLLDRLLDKLPPEPLVFVGDYIDRGDDSAGVLRRLADLQVSRDDVFCLMGNHEDMLLKFIDNPSRHGSSWLRFGGLQTLASLGVAPPLEADPSEAAWQEAAEATTRALGADLLSWIAALPSLWQSGNLAVVHAGADPALPIGVQSRNTLVWGHDDFLGTARQDGIWVVHGHTIFEDPTPIRGRIPIDTGAYATGRLTAARISPGGVDFITA